MVSTASRSRPVLERLSSSKWAKPRCIPKSFPRKPTLTKAAVAYPASAKTLAAVGAEGPRPVKEGARPPAPCWEGSCEVYSDAVAGRVHGAWEEACSKRKERAANRSRHGVRPRSFP